MWAMITVVSNKIGNGHGMCVWPSMWCLASPLTEMAGKAMGVFAHPSDIQCRLWRIRRIIQLGRRTMMWYLTSPLTSMNWSSEKASAHQCHIEPRLQWIWREMRQFRWYINAIFHFFSEEHGHALTGELVHWYDVLRHLRRSWQIKRRLLWRRGSTAIFFSEKHSEKCSKCDCASMQSLASSPTYKLRNGAGALTCASHV